MKKIAMAIVISALLAPPVLAGERTDEAKTLEMRQSVSAPPSSSDYPSLIALIGVSGSPAFLTDEELAKVEGQGALVVDGSGFGNVSGTDGSITCRVGCQGHAVMTPSTNINMTLNNH